MKILIAEDENRLRQSLKRGFEFEKFIVDEAENGSEAIYQIKNNQYDVVILDWMMPKKTGLEVCAEMRSANIFTPVIMLTAKGQIKDKVEALNIGADDYLVKPFSFMELVARVKALARRPVKMQDEILKVGDLELNTSTFAAKRFNKNIELSKTEYKLLKYLMRNPGQIISKENLIQNVWDFDADILPNTVEAHIKTLRAKIDKKFSKSTKLIQTVRGFGYKIEGKNVK